MLRMLPVGSLVPAADNVRRRVGDVRELAASVASVGIVEPLLVSPLDAERYVIVAGHRRHAAAVRAGLAEVPCTVRELSEAERVEIMLVENLQRSDLTAIEEASGLFRLVECGMTQKELARRIGRSARRVAARLALLELPKVVQEEVHAGSMSVGEAQALLVFRDDPELIERLVADQWSRRDLERAVVREQHRQAAARANAERRERSDEGSTVVAQAAGGTGDEEVTDPGGDAAAAGPPGDLAGSALSERQAAGRAEARARTAASAARIAFAQALVGRKVVKADVAELVGRQLLAEVSVAQARLACRILALDAVVGRFGPDHRAALDGYAARTAANRDRALLAVALAVGEERARFAGEHEVAERHRAFLASYGFEPDQV
ncbi:MAG: ParB/RepB/Spo0J family partition protein [Acidimicrobiales bacterium]